MGRQRFMKSREIIEMIESGTPMMEKRRPEASGPQTSGLSPSDPSLGPVARPSSPSSPSDRVSQVRAANNSTTGLLPVGTL